MGEEVTEEAARAAEISKYQKVYVRPKYRMGEERLKASRQALLDYGAGRCSYLDVGAGRGEMLRFAMGLDFTTIQGTEVVQELLSNDMTRLVYAEAHQLPFDEREFEVVSCFDVLEHLTPADVAPAIDELLRVASRIVIISAAADSQLIDGVEHHVSRRSLKDWRKLIEQRAGIITSWKLMETRPCRKGSDLWVLWRAQ